MSQLFEHSYTKSTHPGEVSSGVSLVDINSVYFHFILILFLQVNPQVPTDGRHTDDERAVRK